MSDVVSVSASIDNSTILSSANILMLLDDVWVKILSAGGRPSSILMSRKMFRYYLHALPFEHRVTVGKVPPALIYLSGVIKCDAVLDDSISGLEGRFIDSDSLVIGVLVE